MNRGFSTSVTEEQFDYLHRLPRGASSKLIRNAIDFYINRPILPPLQLVYKGLESKKIRQYEVQDFINKLQSKLDGMKVE